MSTEYICGISCERALHWRWIARSKYSQLQTLDLAYVRPGHVVSWQSQPELVITGNTSVGGVITTQNRQGNQRRRRFKDYVKTFPDLTTTGRIK